MLLLVSVFVVVVRVTVVQVLYLFVFLSDQLLCVCVRHTRYHRDGEVCSTLPG